MNKVELKVSYNKFRYMQKKLRAIDWNNPSKKDVEFNSKIQNNIRVFKGSLSDQEAAFLKEFETEKESSHLNHLRNQSRELESRFVKVVYCGGGWYVFSPLAHKFYNRNDEVKIQGIKNLGNILKNYGKWSILSNKVIGF